MESKLKKSIETGTQRLNAENVTIENVLTTTLKNWVLSDQCEKTIVTDAKIKAKRQATSPAKGAIHKRSAFGNISNVIRQNNITKCLEPVKVQAQKENRGKRRSLRLQAKAYLSKPLACVEAKSEEKIFDDNSSTVSSSNDSCTSAEENPAKDVLDVTPLPTSFYEYTVSPRRRCLDYVDHDATNVNSVNEAPTYAFTVFEYMRTREQQFVIQPNYLSQKQTELTPDMRAILVDWMVEVQENFELNHETLYLAVKLVDHYLQEVEVKREKLQLVGATALLLAAKFDERHPPYIDDFLYICDDAYRRNDILTTERSILIRIGFDINIPISYRFLRRYAKCLKVSMETLTLARFILELSLQSYVMVDRSASLLGAAALWLAMKMKCSNQEWDDTLIYYTARNEEEVIELACELNTMVIESKPKKLKTIWQKYSHTIFYEVAKTPSLSSDQIEVERSRVLNQAQFLSQ